VRADASWRFELVTRPRLARQVGGVAATGLDTVAGRAAKPIDELGDDRPPPAAWPLDVDGDSPPCKAGVVGTCRGRGSLPDAPLDDVRTAALFAQTTFQLTRPFVS